MCSTKREGLKVYGLSCDGEEMPASDTEGMGF